MNGREIKRRPRLTELQMADHIASTARCQAISSLMSVGQAATFTAVYAPATYFARHMGSSSYLYAADG